MAKCMPLPPPPDLVLSKERWAELSEIADWKGVHRSEIISEAIIFYLDNLKATPISGGRDQEASITAT